MKAKLWCSLAVGCVPFVVLADMLELKDGTLLNGSYLGGTAASIRFETDAGLRVVPKSDALALTFTAPAPKPAPVAVAPAPAVASATPVAAVAAGGPVEVPSGTKLTVKMEDAVSSANAAGRKFSARLVADLIVDGEVAAKAGTLVVGEAEMAKQAGRLMGKSKLALTLTGMDFNGKLVEIETTDYAEAGQNSLKKSARNAGLGALIGSSVDGSKGAGTGAAIGLGSSVLRRGDSVTIPAGALLEFLVTQPFEAPGAGK